MGSRPLLLDTHTLLWWLLDHPRLSAKAKTAIAESNRRVMVSSASGWELAIKVQNAKWQEANGLIEQLPQLLRKERFELLPMGLEHALAAGKLPGPHRDPFDRMLMAQAQIERAVVVTVDTVFAEYQVPTLW